MSNPNAEPNEPRSRRDALNELQSRVEAAIDDARPKFRRLLEELDSKVDAAVADLKPRAQSAMREVQPKVDQFVSDMQPRLDALLERLQSRIDEFRRDLDARASRTPRDQAGAASAELAAGPSEPPRDASAGTTEGGETGTPPGGV